MKVLGIKKTKLIKVRFQKIVKDKNFQCLRKHEKYAGVDLQGNNPQAKFIQGQVTLEGFSGRSFAKGILLEEIPMEESQTNVGKQFQEKSILKFDY